MTAGKDDRQSIPAEKGDAMRRTRLKSALRDNLKRRKAAPRAAKPEQEGETSEAE